MKLPEQIINKKFKAGEIDKETAFKQLKELMKDIKR